MSSTPTTSAAPAELVATFYRAFAAKDAEGMVACYGPSIVFSDPVFPHLVGDDAGDMWRMLCGRAKDLTVEAHGITVDGSTGQCTWIARYTFRTGRRVENHVRARLTFEGGRIVRHVDDFSFWRWSRQALGPAGLLLGWTPMLRGKVRAEAAKGLAEFRARNR